MLTRLEVLRQKKLVVNIEAVRRLHDHDLGRHVLGDGKVLRKRREDQSSSSPFHGHDADGRRLRRAEVQHRDLLPRCERLWRRLDAVAGRDLRRCTTRRRHGPDVPLLDVVGVRAVVERLAIARERRRCRVLDQPVRRRQHHRCRGARDADRIVSIPLVVRRRDRKDEAVSRPHQPADSGEDSIVRSVVPELARRALGTKSFRGRRGTAGDVGDHDRERVPAPERRGVEARCAPSACRVGSSAPPFAATAGSAGSAGSAAPTPGCYRGATAGASATTTSSHGSDCGPARIPDSARALLRLKAERNPWSSCERDLFAVG